MTWLSAIAAKAIAAAATITGKKFALMVASSLVATTGVVAAGLTEKSNDLGPLAGLLGRPVAASEEPAVRRSRSRTRRSGGRNGRRVLP